MMNDEERTAGGLRLVVKGITETGRALENSRFYSRTMAYPTEATLEVDKQRLIEQLRRWAAEDNEEFHLIQWELRRKH